MNLRVVMPCAELSPFVRYYWVLKSREKFSILRACLKTNVNNK